MTVILFLLAAFCSIVALAECIKYAVLKRYKMIPLVILLVFVPMLLTEYFVWKYVKTGLGTYRVIGGLSAGIGLLLMLVEDKVVQE